MYSAAEGGVSLFEKVVFFSGPNVWIVILNLLGYKDFSGNLLKYKGGVLDIVTTASEDGCIVKYYPTDIIPTSRYNYTYVESTIKYRAVFLIYIPRYIFLSIYCTFGYRKCLYF